MERKAILEEAGKLFGKNFIGPKELKRYSTQLGIMVPAFVPEIPYDVETLSVKSRDCLLVLGLSHMHDGRPLTIMSLRDHFGTDPKISEPCFYNQDWYLKEKFVNTQLECKWNLISASLLDDSRGKNPETFAKPCAFPPAVLCTYVFFVGWFHLSKVLWEHDFVWCGDVDHNGDRVYVGKYHDIAGVNKNGFSIHRHLSLRDCYGRVLFD